MHWKTRAPNVQEMKVKEPNNGVFDGVSQSAAMTIWSRHAHVKNKFNASKLRVDSREGSARARNAGKTKQMSGTSES